MSPHISSAKGIWQDVVANRRAYLMAASACWGGMLFGWDTGLIGGILPRASFKHSFGLDKNPAAFADLSGWIVSVLQAGCFFGAMSAAWISDWFGRKAALLIAAAIFHFGSILQTTPTLNGQSPSSALIQLYIGRAIGGFGVGLVSVCVPTYISESAPSHLRGRLTGMYQLFNVTGIALAFWVNYGLLQQFGEDATAKAQWTIAFALQMIPGLLLVIFMVFQNESPRWLAEKGRSEESRIVLANLRGLPIDHEIVTSEYQAIKDDFEGRVRLTVWQQAKEATSSTKMFYRCSLPFVLMAFQQWTGTNSMNYYSPVIFQQLGMKGGQASLLGTGVYGIVKIVMTAICLALGIEQFGRKATLVWGGLGQSLCLFFVGGYRALHKGENVDAGSYIAIVAIYLYVSAYSLGWSVAAWPAMSESVPNHLRSLTMATGLMSSWLFNFTISKITPILLKEITYGTFLLFAGTTLLAVVWTIFFLPETGGIPIEEIHNLFEGSIVKQSLRDNRHLFSRMPRRTSAEQLDAHADDGAESGSTRSFKTYEDKIEKASV
ncbi:hypothetical protein FRC03_003426 [Tulasnella sp. 419]|nr:hypothetical protein FRC02_009904 [Tulasnella sp. 418]KAG8969325.1 hypothetical protein FRC03_003426 [Tulasnella sp. 419]